MPYWNVKGETIIPRSMRIFPCVLGRLGPNIDKSRVWKVDFFDFVGLFISRVIFFLERTWLQLDDILVPKILVRSLYPQRRPHTILTHPKEGKDRSLLFGHEEGGGALVYHRKVDPSSPVYADAIYIIGLDQATQEARINEFNSVKEHETRKKEFLDGLLAETGSFSLFLPALFFFFLFVGIL